MAKDDMRATPEPPTGDETVLCVCGHPRSIHHRLILATLDDDDIGACGLCECPKFWRVP